MKRTDAARAAPLTIHARTDEIRRRADRSGWTGDTALGRAIRMSRSATWGVLAGRYAPSAQFIAGVLDAFPGARFEDLFEVVRSPDVPQ